MDGDLMDQLRQGDWVRVLPSKRIDYNYAGMVGYVIFSGVITADIYIPAEDSNIYGIMNKELIFCHGNGTRLP